MKKIMTMVAVFLLVGFIACGVETPGATTQDWPAWRGPAATGVAPDAHPPTSWSESENIRWKVEVPGKGHATPIVFRDRVVVTTAVPSDKRLASEQVQAAEKELPDWSKKTATLPDRFVQFTVLALRRSDGSILWKKQVCEEAPVSATHGDGSWASGSPVTDGERIYAHFGSAGLYCLDLEGNVTWAKRLGVMKTRASFGEGISPVLCGPLIIINWDGETGSFITALDKQTGAERWKVMREERTSWATPLVVVSEGRTQVVVSATGRIRGYDPATGQVLWECKGMTENVIPSPVYDGSSVICMSGFRGSALLAIKLADAKGDISDKAESIAWRHDRDTPYVPSPLLYDNLLYFLKGNTAVLTCLDTRGESCFEKQALAGLKQVYASPVGAGGRVYISDRNGVTAVLEKGPVFRQLATNTLNESFSASAAIAGKELYLRGQTMLYCIAEP